MADEHIDHINRIKFDNRIENLRKSTHQENQWNKPVRIDNFLGVKGSISEGIKIPSPESTVELSGLFLQ